MDGMVGDESPCRDPAEVPQVNSLGTCIFLRPSGGFGPFKQRRFRRTPAALAPPSCGALLRVGALGVQNVTDQVELFFGRGGCRGEIGGHLDLPADRVVHLFDGRARVQ